MRSHPAEVARPMATGLPLERAPRASRGARRDQQENRGGSVAASCLVIGVALVLLIGVAWLAGGLDEAIWWLTHAEPPTVVLAGLPGVVRGSVQITAQLSPRSRIVS